MPTELCHIVICAAPDLPDQPQPEPPCFHSHWIRAAVDPAFAPLNRMCIANHFPPDWASARLAENAHALALLDDSGECRAFGWITPSSLYVEEIRRTFTPPPGSDYLLADLVAPECRGRKLQRWLLHQRLWDARQRRREAVFAIARAENAPSVRNATHVGLKFIALHKSKKFFFGRLDRLVQSPSGVKIAPMLSKEGLPLPFSMRLRRK